MELLDAHVKAELTATMPCSLMQLTFPASDESHLLLNFVSFSQAKPGQHPAQAIRA